LFYAPSTIAIAVLLLVCTELNIDCKNWIELLPGDCLALNSIYAYKNVKYTEKCYGNEVSSSGDKRKNDHNDNDITKKICMNKNEISSIDIDNCYVALQKIKLPPKYRDIINIYINEKFPERNITPSSIIELETLLNK
jgi:hypothetical protein